jgi:hypothetical protein
VKEQGMMAEVAEGSFSDVGNILFFSQYTAVIYLNT